MTDYTWDDIFDKARPNPGDDGKWSKAVIAVNGGDTAPIPGTTKHRLTTAGLYQYDIHPSGVLLKKL
ncbi:hypothetical protein [Kribbella italica]|uniref:Uncharacterized protein n=1 Tax=Kribbella italica TaxID=1540520 RepID=A0A7W9J1N3_9ACTN|nr:hypothetical protein [Kribbella italica]MBB5833427.1 hypothetical protein [Kribbella italica]